MTTLRDTAGSRPDIGADDMQHMEAAEVGHALRGFGLNLLCRQVMSLADSIAAVLEMRVIRANDDYALMTGPAVAETLIIQLHADLTYHANPLMSLLPEAGARGAGAELRLFGMDPDAAAQRAVAAGWHVLQEPTDKCVKPFCWISKAIAGCLAGLSADRPALFI